MPRSPIRVACALFAALSCASLAHAVPSAANSRIPSHVLLVGRLGDLADTTAGACSIVVRDAANSPIARCQVELRVLNCFGTRLSSEPYAPATTIRCETSGVLQTTDGHGEVRMTAVGGGTPGSEPGAGPCSQIYAAGVALGIITLATLDMDGRDGLTPHDVSLWLTDLASGELRGRADFDGDGVLTAQDLSIFLTVWAAGRSQESAASYCT